MANVNRRATGTWQCDHAKNSSKRNVCQRRYGACQPPAAALATATSISRASGRMMMACSVVPWLTACSSRTTSAVPTGWSVSAHACTMFCPASYRHSDEKYTWYPKLSSGRSGS
eukprot:5171791-Prymnesium_polylepis.2